VISFLWVSGLMLLSRIDGIVKSANDSGQSRGERMMKVMVRVMSSQSGNSHTQLG